MTAWVKIGANEKQWSAQNFICFLDLWLKKNEKKESNFVIVTANIYYKENRSYTHHRTEKKVFALVMQVDCFS
jgi:hypothetical protein